MEHYVSDIDGFHPSNAGHAAIAELFLRLILPQFAPSSGARIGAARVRVDPLA